MRNFSVALFMAALLAAAGAPAAPDRVPVLVVQHGWHTGIAVPAELMPGALDFLDARFKDAHWYEFGWGDRKFYRNTDSAWLALRAMLWPTDTVLHVVGLDRHPPGFPHGEIAQRCVSRKALHQLMLSIAEDFRLDDTGAPMPLGPGLYGDSLFFAAKGSFWFGRTCNTWTASRLREAGVDIRSFPALTASSVMGQLKGVEPAVSCAGGAPDEPQD